MGDISDKWPSLSAPIIWLNVLNNSVSELSLADGGRYCSYNCDQSTAFTGKRAYRWSNIVHASWNIADEDLSGFCKSSDFLQEEHRNIARPAVEQKQKREVMKQPGLLIISKCKQLPAHEHHAGIPRF